MKHWIEFAPLGNTGIITNLEKSDFFTDLQKCMELADKLYNKGSQYIKVVREDGAIYCEIEY